jgi:hypothetical protein
VRGEHLGDASRDMQACPTIRIGASQREGGPNRNIRSFLIAMKRRLHMGSIKFTCWSDC